MASNLLSGSLSGMTAVFSKMVLIIFAMTHGVDCLTMPAFYIGMSTVAFCMIFTVYNMNLNLAYYSQLVVVPLYQCCTIIGTICGGCFIMGEFKYYSDTELRIIAIGNSISIFGIIYKVCMLESKDIEAEEASSDEN